MTLLGLLGRTIGAERLRMPPGPSATPSLRRRRCPPAMCLGEHHVGPTRPRTVRRCRSTRRWPSWHRVDGGVEVALDQARPWRLQPKPTRRATGSDRCRRSPAVRRRPARAVPESPPATAISTWASRSGATRRSPNGGRSFDGIVEGMRDGIVDQRRRQRRHRPGRVGAAPVRAAGTTSARGPRVAPPRHRRGRPCAAGCCRARRAASRTHDASTDGAPRTRRAPPPRPRRTVRRCGASRRGAPGTGR